jgi:flagellar basal-body rod modification protein FlgD
MTVRYNNNMAIDTMNAIQRHQGAMAANKQEVETSIAAKKFGQNVQDFFKLLITQLQYQDPLEPLDTKDLVGQLVQFSTVEQALNTNSKLDDLIKVQRENQSVEALRFIGQVVGYEGNTMHYDGEKPDILFSLSQEVPEVRVNIYDSAGRLVQVEHLPGIPGQQRIDFKGVDLMGRPLEQGAYLIEAQALQANGTPVYDLKGDLIKIPVYLSGRVTNIERVQSNAVLAIGDVQVPMDKILSVRDHAPTSGATAAPTVEQITAGTNPATEDNA